MLNISEDIPPVCYRLNGTQKLDDFGASGLKAHPIDSISDIAYNFTRFNITFVKTSGYGFSFNKTSKFD